VSITTEDVKYVDCKHCDGTGTVDPTETLDLGDLEAVRKELVSIATAEGNYSIRGADRSNRVHYLARISFLASRAIWLESIAQHREDQQERFSHSAEDLTLIKDLPGTTPWNEARKILAQRKADADEYTAVYDEAAAVIAAGNDAEAWREEVEMMGRALDG